MPQKFQGKYRNGTDRATWWEYTQTASYFITICTFNRVHHFGEIKNGYMCLSHEGTIAWQYWNVIPTHFPFVTLGEFVIMPDHMHGIINVSALDFVGVLHATRQQNPTHQQNLTRQQYQSEIDSQYRKYMSTISPKHGSLGSIIRSYKSAVSKEIHHFNPDFRWQSRYYDHIIRDVNSFHDISQYIRDNPLRWQGKDKEPII